MVVSDFLDNSLMPSMPITRHLFRYAMCTNQKENPADKFNHLLILKKPSGTDATVDSKMHNSQDGPAQSPRLAEHEVVRDHAFDVNRNFEELCKTEIAERSAVNTGARKATSQ